MSTTSTAPSSVVAPVAEGHVLHSVQVSLKLAYGLVPIVAGLDKFFGILAHWESYLNPAVLQIIPMDPRTFMYAVGVIEIIAGICVFAKTRFGALLVMAWLIAIALQLIMMGQFLDIAVRDLVMALGALTLARLTALEGRTGVRT
jgi:uncharacterized membrane protein YphA (DoxX/SURF4 family)